MSTTLRPRLPSHTPGPPSCHPRSPPCILSSTPLMPAPTKTRAQTHLLIDNCLVDAVGNSNAGNRKDAQVLQRHLKDVLAVLPEGCPVLNVHVFLGTHGRAGSRGSSRGRSAGRHDDGGKTVREHSGRGRGAPDGASVTRVVGVVRTGRCVVVSKGVSTSSSPSPDELGKVLSDYQIV